MKINYTALILTVLALAGLAIYRMLTPDEFVMLLSKPDNSGFTFAYSKTTERWFPLQNEYQEYGVYKEGLMQNPVLLKESSYKFRLFYKTMNPGFKLIAAESDDLQEWDKERRIFAVQADSVISFRILKTGKHTWQFLLLRTNQAGSYIESYTSDDLKSFQDPHTVFSSADRLNDFNVVALDHGFLLFTLSRDVVGSTNVFSAWFSTDLKESLIPVKTGKTDVQIESLNALYVIRDDIYLVANHNQIINLVRKDPDSLDYSPEVLATNVPPDYGIYSVIHMRRDEVKRLKKTLTNMH